MNRSTLVEIDAFLEMMGFSKANTQRIKMEFVLTSWLSDMGLTEKDIMRNEYPDDIDGYVYCNANTGEKLFSVYGDRFTNHKTGEVLAFD